MFLRSFLSIIGFAYGATSQSCPDYSSYSQTRHEPYSSGKYQLSYARPAENCRTFISKDVEDTISRLKSTIADPDLARIFENSFPNTVDTAIKWKGYAADNADEELTFVITGDINAMWLRDSSNQMQSYLSLLKANSSADSIASLFRGVINLQARYLLTSTYCNSFQPPVESKIPPDTNGAAETDKVTPSYSNSFVFECKYELDSLAAFLEVSTNYYDETQDLDFFKKYHWVDAIKAIMKAASDMRTPTYASDGSVNKSPYTFQRSNTSPTETLANAGIGNPVQGGTGLIRSAFRPSDDSTIYQLFIPANMMFSRYLNSTAGIMTALGTEADLASQMAQLSASLETAITNHGIVDNAKHGKVYAYEVDGYGSANIMDDANIPSLLSAPFIGYLSASDPVYKATRDLLLSADNPYFMRGPVINAIGGPHAGLGKAWPMASIVRILTSDDDNEIRTSLKEIVSSTAGLGLIHESINSFDQNNWSRQW